MNPKTKDEHLFMQLSIATFFANNRHLFPVIDTVNEFLVQLLTNEQLKASIIEKLSLAENFKPLRDELYATVDAAKNYVKGPFGALVPNKDIVEISVEEALNDISAILQNKQANLIDILPIYSVLGFRVIRVLEPKLYDEAGKAFATEKKSIEDEKKQAVTRKVPLDKELTDIIPTTQLGTPMSASYTYAFNNSAQSRALLQRIALPEHRTSWQRFNVDSMLNLQIIGDFAKHGLPLVAGPSTHVMTLLTAVNALQTHLSFTLTKEELHSLSVAYMAYLVIAGYHTGDEVLFSASECLNIKYNFDDFVANIPAEIKENAEFKAFLNSVEKKMELLSGNAAHNSQGFFAGSATSGNEDVPDSSLVRSFTLLD